ncbi:maltotransferase domain-containing protein [Mycobacterium lepromatosis]|uniref:maltotransferase domain-containing protein n=1 Tax=Mycobacterium lepromatosis TaxID=480418 RepID=UPI003B50E2A5
MHPAKAVVGEMVAVSATVWREGHEAVRHPGYPQSWVTLSARDENSPDQCGRGPKPVLQPHPPRPDESSRC